MFFVCRTDLLRTNHVDCLHGWTINLQLRRSTDVVYYFDFKKACDSDKIKNYSSNLKLMALPVLVQFTVLYEEYLRAVH